MRKIPLLINLILHLLFE